MRALRKEAHTGMHLTVITKLSCNPVGSKQIAALDALQNDHPWGKPGQCLEARSTHP